MDLADFLRAVVPWSDGFTTIHWQAPGKGQSFLGKSFKTVEDAVEFIVRKLNAPSNISQRNIYFCLSRQSIGGGKRGRDYAVSVRTLWLDIDLGSGDNKYARIAEAVAAVLRFCMQLGIPKPSLIVLSGGGLHVYWLSDKDLTIAQWQPLADGLKAAAKAYGLKADLGLTGDIARVLRVPGTFNYKYDPPRQVRILKQWSTLKAHDLAKAFAVLDNVPEAAKTWSPGLLGKKVAPAFAGLPLRSLGEGIEDPPISFPAIKAKCGWLREAHDTGGKDLTGNMQWNLLVLTATFLENGNELAHQLVNQHPDYTFEGTERQWSRKVRERGNQGIGFPGCRAISDSGSRHCESCPLLSHNKSPLNIGLGVIDNAQPQENSPEEEVRHQEEVAQEIKILGGSRPEELRLPEGFAVDEKGRICAYIESKIDSKGRTLANPRLLHVLKTQIKDPVLQYQDGQLGLGFIASIDKGNYDKVFLPLVNMTLQYGLIKTLATKGVVHNSEGEAPKMLEKFATSWLDLLRQEDVAICNPGTLGWYYENGVKAGFVHGNTLYRADGSKTVLLAAADSEFRTWYTPVGKREVWLKAAKLLTDRKRPQLDILIAVSFAAPLTAFGGTLYGATLSMWGDPGTSKSTAQQVAAAVFGHPKQTRESLNSTPKSVQKRLGLTKNLAAYWDDVQDERHQDNLFTTMFVTAGGLEGGRLNQDASMKTRLDWQTLLVACSNASFIEYLIRKQKSTTAGMRRVFEIEFKKKEDEPGMIDAMDASKTFAALEHNYGVIGAEYAELLAREHKEIDALVDVTTKKFKAAVKGSGDESFWWGMCGVLLAGAELANRLGAELDVKTMDLFLQNEFENNRHIRKTEGTEGGSLANTELHLTNFLSKHIGEGNVIYIDVMFTNMSKEVDTLRSPGQNKPIFIQIVKDENRIVISKKAFKDYMEKSDVHSRQVLDGLITFFDAEAVRVTLGAGTNFAQAQERCYSIPVPDNKNHVLQQTLAAYDKIKPSSRPS